MALTLDPALEQRIQQVVATGAFREPSELLTHALDLVTAENDSEAWLTRNREAIHADIEEAFGQDERGEGFSLEEVAQHLHARRAAKAA